MREFERRADRLAAAIPQLRLTNWGRSRARNARVGGKPNSQHLVWTAADFTAPNRATYAAAVATARQLGLVAIDEGDHLHVQLFTAGQIPAWVYDVIPT